MLLAPAPDFFLVTDFLFFFRFTNKYGFTFTIINSIARASTAQCTTDLNDKYFLALIRALYYPVRLAVIASGITFILICHLFEPRQVF